MFLFNKKKTTEPQIVLYDLLKAKGVEAILEYYDGHKTVDIAIPEAKLFIEIDGLDHFTDPEKIETDFKREHYSDVSKFSTIHIPNIIINHHAWRVAEGIVKVVNKRLNNTK